MALMIMNPDGYITEILPGLYLGDIYVAQNYTLLQATGIKKVINASNSNSYATFPGIEYVHIPIYDFPSENIAVYFDQTNREIDESLRKGEKVLVHCMAGVSRSISIILAYMVLKGYTLRNALDYVYNKRPNQYVRPNTSFFQQLIEYEVMKKGKASITMDEYRAYIEYTISRR